jgi:sRNA-binding carbon storage regulator CsrA
MLCLSRKTKSTHPDECSVKLRVAGYEIEVTVMKHNGRSIVLGFEAAPEVSITRTELDKARRRVGA